MLLRIARTFIRAATLWVIVVTFAFALFHVVPNDPARTILGPNATEAQVEQLRRELGLDLPLGRQFSAYVSSVASLNLGVSYVDKRSVSSEVYARMPLTTALGTGALLFTLLYLALVVVAQHNGMASLIASIDFLISSMPTLFVAVVVVILVSANYPFRYSGASVLSVHNILALFPACLVLALYPMAALSRLLRQQFRETSSAMFVTVARAKGLSERRISFVHILSNAAIPVVAALGNLIPAMLTGAFIVEIVFSLPGMGALLVRSILQRDLPMIEGIVMINAALTIAISFLIDLILIAINPRSKPDAR